MSVQRINKKQLSRPLFTCEKCDVSETFAHGTHARTRPIHQSEYRALHLVAGHLAPPAAPMQMNQSTELQLIAALMEQVNQETS